jgi:hypothetical protein
MPVLCVKLARGVNLNYDFGKDCRIEYFDVDGLVSDVAKPAEAVKSLADMVFTLDEKFEEFESEEK